MPSDAKKREQQRKKDQAKARQSGKKQANGKPEEDNKLKNGVTQNGTVELSAEGNLIH